VELLDSAVDVPGGFLDLFGKPARESACECERSGTMMLGPVLNLVNGPVVADAIKDPGNRIPKILKHQKDDVKGVEDPHLATLCRLPTAAELTAGVRAIHEGESDYQAWLGEYERRKAALDAYEKTLDSQQAKWEEESRAATAWEALEFLSAKASSGAKLA